MKVLILMGLPGSGKTTFAKELESSNNKLNKYDKLTKFIDFDDLLKGYKKNAVNKLTTLNENNEIYIIDGLIHTNEQLTLVINALVKNNELTEIEIHYWEENRTQCLINDINRRDISSAFSIKTLPLDVPNLDELPFDNITMKRHQVAVKPDWLVFSDKYNLGCTINQPYLKSDSWSTGGSSGNCWNDEITYYDGNESLANFEAFDNLITSIDPTISFLTYRKLYAISCSMGEIHERDYYGGSGSHYTYYQCNVEVLYNELVTLGIL
jgi:adenylate kinase family enzyme